MSELINLVHQEIFYMDIKCHEMFTGKFEAMKLIKFHDTSSILADDSIGFSTGGAKDINNFRENIAQGYLPLSTDITYEGLFYDYFFNTSAEEKCNKLFCPSYSYAITRDPFSKKPNYYLSVGLNSGIKDFQRKKLNLVVVLDHSGSMDSSFDQYYYDQFGNMVVLEDDDFGKKKMDIADEVVVSLLSHLSEDDRFGLVIFSDDASVIEPLTKLKTKDIEKLKENILEIKSSDSTNMEAGMKKGTMLFDKFLDADKEQYENRIIFLTDAMPNLGEIGEGELSAMLKENAANGIYTTFIGIGVDFNTQLIDDITKIRGSNYYSVHSSSEFRERMDEEFDYMVTPLVFDLRLYLDAKGYEIEKIYGSPEADEASGDLMKVNTLFPSKADAGQVKGGVILAKLKKLSDDGSLLLKVSYKDRNGTKDSDEALVSMAQVEPDFYQNDGIRKAVLLSRYADLLKDWIKDERKAIDSGEEIAPTVSLEDGIIVPISFSQWERQSLPLQVASPYRKLFAVFGSYFAEEAKAIGDDTLGREEDILNRLANFSATKR